MSLHSHKQMDQLLGKTSLTSYSLTYVFQYLQRVITNKVADLLSPPEGKLLMGLRIILYQNSQAAKKSMRPQKGQDEKVGKSNHGSQQMVVIVS